MRIPRKKKKKYKKLWEYNLKRKLIIVKSTIRKDDDDGWECMAKLK